jgi:hypothetical protein
MTTQAPPLHQSRDIYGGGGELELELQNTICGVDLQIFYKCVLCELGLYDRDVHPLQIQITFFHLTLGARGSVVG